MLLVLVTAFAGITPMAAGRALARVQLKTGTSIAGGFSATIYQGSDKGKTFVGQLELTASSGGRLTGKLVRNSGTAIPVSGQLTGVAINLVFYLPGSKHIFGVGTFGQDPTSKQWAVGGPLVGPGKGDSGDWDMACLLCRTGTDGGIIACIAIPCPTSNPTTK
jgi:hypothetical protein